MVQPLPPRDGDAPRRAGAVAGAGPAAPHQLRGHRPPLRGARRPLRVPQGRGALARCPRPHRGGGGRRPPVAGGLRRRLRHGDRQPPGARRRLQEPDPPRRRPHGGDPDGRHQQRPLRRALRRGHARGPRLHPADRRPLAGQRPADQPRVLAEARRQDGPPALRGGGGRRQGRRGDLCLRTALRRVPLPGPPARAWGSGPAVGGVVDRGPGETLLGGGPPALPGNEEVAVRLGQRGGGRAAAPGAPGHPPGRVLRLLPAGRGHRRPCQAGPRHPLRLPGLGGGFAGGLRPRHLRRRPHPLRPGLRAVHERAPPGDPRHRCRLRVRPQGGGQRLHPRDLRPALRHGGDDGDVPGPGIPPGGRQGPRAAAERDRHRRQGLPAHLGGGHPRGARRPAGGGGALLDLLPAGDPLRPGQPPRRLPPPPGPASLGGDPLRRRPPRPHADAALLRGLPRLPVRQGRRRCPGARQARRPRGADVLDHRPHPGRGRAYPRRPPRHRQRRPGRPRHLRTHPGLRDDGVLPDRVPRPARAARQVPAGPLRRPDHRHLVVPPRPGEVGHGPPVPRAPDGPGAHHLPPSLPAG